MLAGVARRRHVERHGQLEVHRGMRHFNSSRRRVTILIDLRGGERLRVGHLVAEGEHDDGVPFSSCDDDRLYQAYAAHHRK